MNNASRVIVNTTAQYARMVINICLSLYATRLVLSALGVNDYGIYTLVAGIVSLLSFIVNAMVITTQRYMSFYYGRKDYEKLKEIFCSSVILHLAFGIIIMGILELLGFFLFNGFLNISPERMATAYNIYHYMNVMLVVTFITAPFRALLISHENIVYISIIDVEDGVLKLLIALLIMRVDTDKLMLYVLLLFAIQVFNFFAFAVYDYFKYDECILPQKKYYRPGYVREISSFAGWTIYGIGCMTGRTQGFSIILNKFFSTAVNASFGIALQVSGALNQLSASLMNAMNPQIVKAEGSGYRSKMLRLSEMESKFCFFLMSMISIPFIFEMPAILSIWLGEVPNYAVFFCRFIVLTSLVDQLTSGLITANQAIGNVKQYSIVINSIKILTLLPIVINLILGGDLLICMWIYVGMEFLCAMCRLPFIRNTGGLSVRDFFNRVFVKEIVPTVVIIMVSYLTTLAFDSSWRFILTIVLSFVFGLLSIALFGLCKDEKDIIYRVISSIKNRMH